MLLTSPLADLAFVQVGVKTLSGRSIPRDPLQSAEVRIGLGGVRVVVAAVARRLCCRSAGVPCLKVDDLFQCGL